ncbi:hypothetical protein JCM10908_001244 [Rhodotorula pacifica]|uniref:uncharacterized protein n=1 Tax=Rhodotorula pacifica TaxID=1495444 RepID=UPI00317DB2B9
MSKRISLPGTSAKSQGYAPIDTPIKEHTVSGGGIREQVPIELGDLANDEFYDRVARTRDAIRTIDESITSLQTKQALSLQSPSEALSVEIATLSSTLSSQITFNRSRISTLAEQVGKDEARRGHWENLKAALGRSVEKWQKVERDHREKVREKISRQMKIELDAVNPAVTEEEIKAAVDTSSGTAPQIFQQALVGSRTAAARTALNEAQSRRSELLLIEETLTELAALMQQVADLVVTQDSQLSHLEQTSSEIKTDLEKGAQQLGVARVSAAAARHKRKLCAGVLLALVVVVVVVIVVEVKQSQA